MKKLILSLIVIATLSTFSSVLAWDGCIKAGPYSITTGQLCSAPIRLICAVNDNYNWQTGALCTTIQSNIVPINPAPIVNTAVPSSEINVGTISIYHLPYFFKPAA